MASERERFSFLLARTFKRWDVDEFLEEMGDERFEQWWQVYQVDPWGPERDDWRTRMLAAISGVPGDVVWLEFPNSFAVENKLKGVTNGQ